MQQLWESLPLNPLLTRIEPQPHRSVENQWDFWQSKWNIPKCVKCSIPQLDSRIPTQWEIQVWPLQYLSTHLLKQDREGTGRSRRQADNTTQDEYQTLQYQVSTRLPEYSSNTFPPLENAYKSDVDRASAGGVCTPSSRDNALKISKRQEKVNTM